MLTVFIVRSDCHMEFILNGIHIHNNRELSIIVEHGRAI